MASLTNTKIKNTYVSLLKVADNGQLDAALQDITDGAGNSTGIQLNTGGDLTASGTVSFGSLKDTGENITISKFVDAADGIGGNDNDTSIPTSAAVKLYVDTNITAQDLDFTTDSGTGAVDLDSQTFSILGTANEIETSGTGQTVTIGLPSSITVDVTGNLTGNVSGSVTGNVTGNLSGNVTGNVTGDITGNVTATSVLVDGVIATTQSIGDNSTKVATTAYVDAAITAEGLDFAGDAGSGTIDLDSEVFTISGTANEVETNASGNSLIVGLPSNVTIGNDLTVTTNATVGGTLGVTGSTGVDGNFDVATNKFTVQAATGNTAVAGTLDATGLASLDGGIDVDGAFTVADTTGNVSTTGTLAVTGITTLTDDLAVDTDTLFVDVSTDRVGINKAVPTVALDVTGDITSSATITGVTLEGTLSATSVLADGVIATTQSTSDNSTKVATTAYVKSVVTAEDLDIAGDSGTGSIDLDSQTLTIAGTANEIETSASGQTITIGLPSTITANVTGNVAGDLTGTVLTAAQTNITSVGTLSSLAVSGNLTVDTNTLFVDAANNRVGIGTSSPAYKMEIDGGSAETRLRISTSGTDADEAGIILANSGKVGFNDGIQIAHGAGITTFKDLAGEVQMAIDVTNSRVGIGTSSPTLTAGATGIDIYDSTDAQIRLHSSNTGTSASDGILFSLAADNDAYVWNYENANFIFGTNSIERLRIDSSGNVGIGVSNPAYDLTLSKSKAAGDVVLQIENTETTGSSRLWFGNNASGTGARIQYFGATHATRPNLFSIGTDAANDVMFETSGSERMRITSGGYLKASNDASYVGSASAWHEINANHSGDPILIVHGSNGSYGGFGLQSRINRTSSGGNYSFFSAFDSAASVTRFVVHDDGDVENINNAYGALSDVKLKENIADASPKLDDLLKVKIRSYNLIENGFKQIGVIAQELEEVFPSMITEKADFKEVEVPQLDENGQEALDENGEVVITKERIELGTTTKSVKYSVFVPMLIKAMQEQQEIINDLKSRIETLEAK
jgi:hypothetical protein